MIKRKLKTLKRLEEIENNFKTETGLSIDMSVFPLPESDSQQQKSNKELSAKFGQVFTPLWLVDKMLDKHDDWNSDLTFHDLCSGCGQFSVRILRKKYTVLGEDFDIDYFLKWRHLFSEIQLSSCRRLLKIFGTDIRIACGDVMQLGKIPDSAVTGCWFLCGNYWIDKTRDVKDLISKNVSEEEFVKFFS